MSWNEVGVPRREIIELTIRAAPDGPVLKPLALDVLLAFEPLTAAGRALELGWRHLEQG